MTIRFEQQENGSWAAYSTIVEDYIYVDATEEELVEWYAERKAEEARDHVREKIAEKSSNGGKERP